MGIKQSSMMCIDENKKCSVTSPISYNDYTAFGNTIPNNDANRQQKLDAYVCGNKSGKVLQCCDKNGPNANVTANGSNLINPIMDANGKIIEYQICKCSTTACQTQNCVGFRKPTNYELCKARSINKTDTIVLNTYIDRILEPKAYPDCYSNCK